MKTLSLFSGAGGLDIGFHRAGFDIIGCVEIEKQYCETLKTNRDNGKYFNPEAKIYCEDIRSFKPEEFVNKKIECVIGGPPCQPFSAAGRRSGGVPGMQDDRGMLFESYCHVLEILRPRVFIFENVYGLKGANNGEAWDEISKSFSALGYSIKAEQILRPVSKLTYPVREEGFESTFRRRQREISKHYKEVAQREIEKRFGNQSHEDCEKEQHLETVIAKTSELLFTKKYFAGYTDRYNKIISEKRPSKSEVEKYISLQRVSTECKSGFLKIHSVSCKETGGQQCKFKVNISGLEKYLIKIDTLELKSELLSVEDIFAEWDIIQKELVDISQFFSLIDIYGHYANRGDTVRVKTQLNGSKNSLLERAINYFGDSNNCGIYLSRETVAGQLDVTVEQIETMILMMRELRYDVRTTNTHPTIRTDEIICTYPFPMLSERVMFEKSKGVNYD